MKKDLSRRDFTKLTTAALGGVMAGAMVGCNNGENGETGENGGNGERVAVTDEESNGENGDAGYDKSKHACRGLNECADLGASKDNECAGQGTCATVEAACAGGNDCKYQGGCGENIANNECAGQGGCHVPIPDEEKWAKARELFEARMSAADMPFGDAPPAG